jgi:hypothetical protein
MANTIGITAFESGVAATNWWEWALVGVIAASGAVGIAAALWYCIGVIRVYSPVSEKVAIDTSE